MSKTPKPPNLTLVKDGDATQAEPKPKKSALDTAADNRRASMKAVLHAVLAEIDADAPPSIHNNGGPGQFSECNRILVIGMAKHSHENGIVKCIASVMTDDDMVIMLERVKHLALTTRRKED